MLKKIINRMVNMCPAAWYIFRRTMQLSTMLLFAAVVLLIDSRSRYFYMCAVSIYELVPALLLIAVIISICIEDMST